MVGDMEKINGSLDDIPAELMAKIFAYLPVHTILQLRGVCKLWNSIISSSSIFRSIWSKHAPMYPPWIIMYSSRDSIAAFNPTSSIWLTLPIPFPSGFTFQKRILTSCGGLICFCNSCDSSRLLFVCNPITKEFKMLPELPFFADHLHAEMVMDDAGSSYSIYVMESLIDKDSLLEGGPQAAFYNSLDDFWYPMHARNLPVLEGCQGGNAVMHERTFFSVSKVGPPHQLTMYNPMVQEVTMLRLPFERSMSLFPPLSIRQGRLFLAGGVWEYLPFSTFNIWELDHLSNKFVQIDCMASASLDDSHFDPLLVTTLQRFGSGDILFFHARELLCPLLYDIKEKYWMCMPRYHGPCKSWVSSIIFEPSFSARV
eukprot:c21348_g1_i1 orf=767-1876(-)